MAFLNTHDTVDDLFAKWLRSWPFLEVWIERPFHKAPLWNMVMTSYASHSHKSNVWSYSFILSRTTKKWPRYAFCQKGDILKVFLYVITTTFVKNASPKHYMIHFLNTLRPRENSRDFVGNIFKAIFVNDSYCILKSTEVCSQGLNRMAWQWAETLVEIRGTLADIRRTTKLGCNLNFPKHEFNRPVCLEAHHYLLAHLSQ